MSWIVRQQQTLSRLHALCPQAHKYVIQAEVLHESWKVNEAQLAFISNLRVAAKNEIGG